MVVERRNKKNDAEVGKFSFLFEINRAVKMSTQSNKMVPEFSDAIYTNFLLICIKAEKNLFILKWKKKKNLADLRPRISRFKWGDPSR